MKLKNCLLFFIFSFTASVVFAQSGYVYYKKQLSSIDDEVTNEYMKQALKLLKTQDYELSFNKNSALFKKVEALSVENKPVVEAFTKSISQFTGEVYFDRIKKSVVHKKDFSGSIFLIHKSKVNWVLARDTLKIDNYLCYKATTTQTIENSEGIHQLKVTAWYAPEISLPYGPDGFGGLPGLILQLENNGILTTVKRIEFLNNRTLKISSPTKGAKITEEEFNAIIKKRFENRNNNK
jgi:GLPGLI family protein